LGERVAHDGAFASRRGSGEGVLVGAALVAALGTHKGCPYDANDGCVGFRFTQRYALTEFFQKNFSATARPLLVK